MTTDEIIKVLRHCAKTYSVTGCFDCMMYGTSDGAPDCIIRLLILAADELARLNAATPWEPATKRYEAAVDAISEKMWIE